MDIKHRVAYGKIKIPGIGTPEVFNNGMSVLALIQQMSRKLVDSPNRYDSNIEIVISFNPIPDEEIDHRSPNQKEADAMLARMFAEGLVTAPDPEIEATWARSPRNKESPNYDRLFDEWCQCAVTSTRDRKTPAELNMLRLYVHEKYLGTEWYEGVTRW